MLRQGTFVSYKNKMKLLKRYNLYVSLLISFICIFGLTRSYVSQSYPLIYTNSVFAFILFFVIWFSIYFVINNVKPRAIYCSFAGSTILALCQRIGAEFASTNTVNFTNYSFYLTTISLAILFCVLISLFIHNYCNIKLLISNILNIRFFSFIFEHKYSILWLWIGFIICWIPAFLAVYPGIYSYDAGPQVWQIYNGAGLNAHHPLVHTLLLDGCFWLGNFISGDYNIGLLIYTIIQSFFMAFCFSLAIEKMKKYKIPLFIRLISFIFFAINPINQIWVLLTTKDVIFAGFLLILFCELIDLSLDPKKYFSTYKNYLKFILVAICMCLFRNQGIYLLLLLIPFSLILLKGYRVRIMIFLLIPLFLVKLFTGPISNMIGVEPGSPREALSVPIQQIARAVNMNPNSITEEEYDVIFSYLPEKNVFSYIPETSDLVKEGFNTELFKKNKIDFFKVWFSVGMKNLQIYVDSFLYGSYGYFYMDHTPYWIQFILFDGAWLEDYQNVLNIKRDSKFPLYEKYLRAVSTSLIHERIPVLSVIMNEAFPFWLIVVSSVFILFRKQYKLFIPILLLIGFWGTCLLGPLIAIRYAYPLIVCIPSLLSLIFVEKEEVSKKLD